MTVTWVDNHGDKRTDETSIQNSKGPRPTGGRSFFRDRRAGGLGCGRRRCPERPARWRRRCPLQGGLPSLSEGIDQAVRAIGNLRNHLNGAPGTKIVVVALGHGIDFLVEGAKDAQGRPLDAPVAALASMGVEFRVCHNSLMAFKVPEDKLLLEAKVVPAGVVEITRLQ